jgi:hypothetical protein
MQPTKCSSSGELVLLKLPPVPSVHSSDDQIERKHRQQSQYIAHYHMLDAKSCVYKTGGESLHKRAFPTQNIRGVATKASAGRARSKAYENTKRENEVKLNLMQQNCNDATSLVTTSLVTDA